MAASDPSRYGRLHHTGPPPPAPTQSREDTTLDTLILFLITIVAWVTLEFWRVLRGDKSISEQVWDLYRKWPPVGMLTGLVVGLLLGHWFWTS